MLLGTQPVVAQGFPVKPIRLIVPAAAGGSTDIGARAIAARLSSELGQSVVVDNRGGAGGRIGAAEVARAAPDGYTLLYGSSITQALLPATAKSVQYDAFKDFTAIGQTFWYSTLIVCNPAMPFNDVAGMIAHAKRNPGKLAIANAGPGSGNHFSAELFRAMVGAQTLNVPYKGNAPAIQDVIGGTSDCIHITEAKAHLDAGRLKAIATTGLKRDPRFPQVPTVDEAGVKGYDMTWWQGVFGPAGVAPAVLARLGDAVRLAATDPAVRAQVMDAGFVPEYLPAQEVAQRVRRDWAKFRKIAADARIELD